MYLRPRGKEKKTQVSSSSHDGPQRFDGLFSAIFFLSVPARAAEDKREEELDGNLSETCCHIRSEGFVLSPTLRRAWPRDGPEAAMCVQGVDVQCVLQFTLIHAAGCALHRRTSRVIHRSKLYIISIVPSFRRETFTNFLFFFLLRGKQIRQEKAEGGTAKRAGRPH